MHLLRVLLNLRQHLLLRRTLQPPLTVIPNILAMKMLHTVRHRITSYP